MSGLGHSRRGRTSSNSGHVRYAADRDRILAQPNDVMGQERTFKHEGDMRRPIMERLQMMYDETATL